MLVVCHSFFWQYLEVIYDNICCQHWSWTADLRMTPASAFTTVRSQSRWRVQCLGWWLLALTGGVTLCRARSRPGHCRARAAGAGARLLPVLQPSLWSAPTPTLLSCNTCRNGMTFLIHTTVAIVLYCWMFKILIIYLDILTYLFCISFHEIMIA